MHRYFVPGFVASASRRVPQCLFRSASKIGAAAQNQPTVLYRPSRFGEYGLLWGRFSLYFTFRHGISTNKIDVAHPARRETTG